ncbi:MAG TPA: hypothetical protein PKW18_13765 [Candidatus Sumerlaeota bacterium]|nr:hypothetical protein [Candidatus Sumerlaeota bacterium]HOR65905.1 hypothetical protein [Candidatus Sumerlaeota bacterium]HPL75621.1 hypothetical protein [Candidatus Sumerlaeota bacterium]HRR31271.1 hypothetical protein [Candidatus Sumerlaeia bacterium]
MQTFQIGDNITKRGLAQKLNKAVRDAEEKPLTLPAAGGINSTTYARAFNSEETDIEIFTPVVISGQMLKRGESQPVLVLKVSFSAKGDNLEAIAVSMGRIRAGAVGVVAIGGLAWCRYDGGGGKFATLEAGNKQLTAGDFGVAQILDTRESEEISASLALIRFPCGAGGESSQWDTHYHDAFLIRANE